MRVCIPPDACVLWDAHVCCLCRNALCTWCVFPSREWPTCLRMCIASHVCMCCVCTHVRARACVCSLGACTTSGERCFFLFRTLTRRNVHTGNKTFLLFSPEDCPNLYVYPSLHPGYRQSQILDARHVSLLDFPAFAMTSVAQVDMGPGDGKLRICYTRLTPL